MAGRIEAWDVEPVVRPGVRPGRRQRLTRMTREQVAGRTGPVRQVRYRDEVVSPLALESGCRTLLLRAQRAIGAVVLSGTFARELSATVGEPVLRQHEWDIAVAPREITELLLDLVSSYGGGAIGPMTAAVMVSQNDAVSLARDALQQAALAAQALVLPGHR